MIRHNLTVFARHFAQLKRMRRGMRWRRIKGEGFEYRLSSAFSSAVGERYSHLSPLISLSLTRQTSQARQSANLTRWQAPTTAQSVAVLSL